LWRKTGPPPADEGVCHLVSDRADCRADRYQMITPSSTLKRLSQYTWKPCKATVRQHTRIRPTRTTTTSTVVVKVTAGRATPICLATRTISAG
jgi:hypothetical protein